ncbi:MAG: GntR family transcriptional regulator [Chitinivibrionales bacterium]|nr:GntR family transcriptional regulator [Chitinivibrionales bacterium]
MNHSDTSKPAIQKACTWIRQSIAGKKFPPGSRLPNIKALARLAGVSPVTMVRAVSLLKDRGILEGVRGQRTRVPDPYTQHSDTAAGDTSPFKIPPDVYTWERVKEQIEKDLITGAFSPAPLLPSCKELQYRYSTSFKTLKKALSSLEGEGMLVRQGNGYAIPAVSRGRNYASITLIGAGDIKGNLNLGALDENFVRLLELECARSGVNLDVITYYYDKKKLVFSLKGAPLSLSSHTTEGYIYLYLGEEHGPEDVIAMLYSFKKPIAVIDDIGGWKLPRPLAPRSDITRFVSVISEKPGTLCARYLLSKGHKQCAFFSPFHAAQWSKNRLAGIIDQYSRAGEGCSVTPFTLDNFIAESDYAQVPKTRRHSMTFADMAKSWMSNIPASYQYHFEPLIREVLDYIGMPRAEIRSQLEPLFDRALTRTEITAWIGANDLVAVMALDFCKRKHVPVPGKISVIGFDDSSEALRNQLSSYNFNHLALAHACINSILRPGSIRTLRKKNVVDIDGLVMERSSCGK